MSDRIMQDEMISRAGQQSMVANLRESNKKIKSWNTCLLIQGENKETQKVFCFQSKSLGSKHLPMIMSQYRLKNIQKKNDITEGSIPICNISQNFKASKIKGDQMGDVNYESQIVLNLGNRDKQDYKISETKHIIKNYGRAILSFILKNKQLVGKIMQKKQVHQLNFLKFCRRMKKKLVTIKQLRTLWLDQQCQYARLLRILSFYYIRKHSLHHIFNSRVVNHHFNIKYRARLLQALQSPRQFTQIKEY